ncbi:5'-nucleotidase C-terminal domain-containing protein [Paraglaciecola sp.]|uniref:bifunctional metallophosphatase/5'-nucleotidase n=1 Tax=Paraglaciecola sp. TaxID=1920173 RepID=UPI0030F39985
MQWNRKYLVKFLLSVVFLFSYNVHASSLYIEKIQSNGTAFKNLYRVHFQKDVNARSTLLSALSQSKKPQELDITLFYFNDLHGKIIIPNAKKGDTFVFAQMTKIVSEARKKNDKSVLFVSGGDDHTGEVYDELLGTNADSFQMSLPYHAYSSAGLDAAVIGNHELDRGVETLKRTIEQDAKFAVLSANINHSSVLEYPMFAPAVIGEIDGVRIAIVGLTSFEDTKTNHKDDPQFKVTPALPVLKSLTAQLEPHVDMILMLSHLGYNQPGIEGDKEVAELLSSLSIPSVIVGGHSHTLLNKDGLEPQNIINGVPVLQAGSWGEYLGELNFSLKYTANKTKPILDLQKNFMHKIEPYINKGSKVDEEFQQRFIAPVVERFNHLLYEKLTNIGNNPHFSTEYTLKTRYIGESLIANVLTDALLSRQHNYSEAKIDAVAINASGIIGGIKPNSALLFKDFFNIMPYADVIQIIELKPAELQKFLDSNAKRIVRKEEIEQVDLSDFINRGFLHFSASIRYTVNLSEQAESAVASAITVHGKSLGSYDSNHKFRLVLGDYITNGNQGWKGKKIGAGLPVSIIGFDVTALTNTNTGYIMRNEIIQSLRERTMVQASEDGRLQLSFIE